MAFVYRLQRPLSRAGFFLRKDRSGLLPRIKRLLLFLLPYIIFFYVVGLAFRFLFKKGFGFITSFNLSGKSLISGLLLKGPLADDLLQIGLEQDFFLQQLLGDFL